MDTRRDLLLEKMTGMQSGLLRFSSKGQRKSLKVQVLDQPSPFLVQVSLTGKKQAQKLLNKPASLSQVTETGYLYISGIVSTTGKKDANVLNMNICKAHWYEKKEKGTTSRLEEISFYG